MNLRSILMTALLSVSTLTFAMDTPTTNAQKEPPIDSVQVGKHGIVIKKDGEMSIHFTRFDGTVVFLSVRGLHGHDGNNHNKIPVGERDRFARVFTHFGITPENVTV